MLDQLELRFGVRNIDNITSPGAVKHLAGTITEPGRLLIESVQISGTVHNSSQLAVIAHSDCAANQVPDATQKEQLTQAAAVLSESLPGMEVLALFLDLKTGFAAV